MFNYSTLVHTWLPPTIIAHIVHLGCFLELSYVASYLPKYISKFLKELVCFLLFDVSRIQQRGVLNE